MAWAFSLLQSVSDQGGEAGLLPQANLQSTAGLILPPDFCPDYLAASSQNLHELDRWQFRMSIPVYQDFAEKLAVGPKVHFFQW